MRKENYIEKLVVVLNPPDKADHIGNDILWEMFENEIGITFPSDYKEFINTYGTGGIDGFMWILTPFVKDENINYQKRMALMLESYKVSQSKFPEYFKDNLFPDLNGLLPWGYTDNGDELYWKTDMDYSNWEIVIYESASSQCYNYKMSLVEFLYKIVSKKIVCIAFPDDFPNSKVKYISVNVE